MNILTNLRRRAAYGLAVALVFACRVAEACPGCKQGIGGDGQGGSFKTNSVALSYAITIGFLLFMVASLITGLGYLMYRNCQVLAAQHQAALREDEGYGDGVRA